MFELPHNCTHFNVSKVIVKILQARPNSMWTVNFQMFKLNLEKAEEPEIKLPNLLDHQKSKRVPEKYLLLFIDDSMDVVNLISGFSAFSKTSLNIWKFTVHVLLKPGLKNFEHYLASMWDECNCEVVWVFFGIAFLWDWNENWPFQVLWPLLSFPNLLACWVQHFYSIIF